MIENQKKQTIFWDVDDIILKSSETVIKCLGNEAQQKNFDDIKDYNFKSINRTISPEAIGDIFESDQFWNNAIINEDFLTILNSEVFCAYNHKLITKGSQLGLDKKRKFLKKNLPILFQNTEEENYLTVGLNECKSIVDMSNGIQIDDMLENLRNTNAKVKILVKNGINTTYNTDYHEDFVNVENLYIVNDLKHVKEILEFNLIMQM